MIKHLLVAVSFADLLTPSANLHAVVIVSNEPGPAPLVTTGGGELWAATSFTVGSPTTWTLVNIATTAMAAAGATQEAFIYTDSGGAPGTAIGGALSIAPSLTSPPSMCAIGIRRAAATEAGASSS